MLLLLASGIVLPSPAHAAAVGSPSPETHLTRTPIQHVIVVIQENHAFDNYFWDYPGAFGLPPGGVPQPSTQQNVSSYQGEYVSNWNYASNQSFSNPEHAETYIRAEEDNGSMDGFYYANGAIPDSLMPPYIVANDLGLSQEYGLADNYYTDFAGPTLPNRFYYYATTSGPVLGDGSPPGNVVTFPNLPQELQNAGVSWASFDGSYNEYPGSGCTFALFPTDPCWYFSYLSSTDPAAQLAPMLYMSWLQSEYNANGSIPQLQNYQNLYTDLGTNSLPSVSWFTSDWLCCTEHPSGNSVSFLGGNITQGQQSVLSLVHAVEDSSYWNNTAIFVTFDEGGGFFDSSPSPSATPYGTGLRVPLIVISPYSRENYVSHSFLTPSSLLHFIEWNWGLPSLSWLDGNANLPLDFFNFSESPRAPLPESDYRSANETFGTPWPSQPVASGYQGSYVPPLLANGEVNWTYQTSNVLAAPPTASGGVLYACGLDGVLRSLDAVTGALNWARPLGSACRAAPTPLPGGGAVATTMLGTVAAYAPNGSLAWNLSLGAPIYGNLTDVNNTLYGALQNGTLFAIGGTPTGLLWEKHVSQAPIYAAPVYDPSDRTLLLSATQDGVIAVTLNGTPLWTAPIPGGVFGGGAVCGSTGYVTSPAGGLYPITLATGAVGPVAPLGNSTATPLCWGSSLYVGDNGTFRAFSLPGLAPTWSYVTHSMAAGAPVVQGSNMVVDTQGGDVYWFAPSGTPSGTLASGSSFFGPVLSTPSGTYFGGEDGNVYGRVSGGEIRVDVSPANASVTVGGAPIETPRGRATVLESPGTVTVAATAPGYVTSSVPVTVRQGRVSYVNLTLALPTSPPTIASFTATPSVIPVGNSTVLSVSASGGVTPYTYSYANLPPGCTTANASLLNCTPSGPGTFNLSVTVSDPVGKSVTATTTLEVTPAVVAPLSVSLVPSPDPVVAGTTTHLESIVSGGAPPYTYTYTGLPAGCSSQNVSTLNCTPSQTGRFTVTVIVHDSSGQLNSSSGALDVTQGAGGGGTTSGPPWTEILILLLVVALLVAVAIVVYFRRRRHRESSAASEPPPARYDGAAGPLPEWAETGPPPQG